MKNFSRIVRWLGHPSIVVFCLSWLMFLVVVGTLTQKNIGLFRAQERYFSSFFFDSSLFPLPGARSVLFVLFIALLAKLLFKSLWSFKQLGINIVHLGAFGLLLGGFFTAYFSNEGSLFIREKESNNIVQDYNYREVVSAHKKNRSLLQKPGCNPMKFFNTKTFHFK